MSPSALATCETVVPGAPAPSAVTGLPTTGADLSSLAWLLVLAGILVTVGVLAARDARRRRGAGSLSALVMVAVVVGVAAAAAPVSSSQAALQSEESTSQCSLITVSDVQRGDARETGALLPGQVADVLAFRVTNLFDAPIELRAKLTPTSGDASAFDADIEADSVLAVTGNLSQSPATPPISLAPGQHADLRVRVGLPLDADRAAATSTFDTVLTAIAD